MTTHDAIDAPYQELWNRYERRGAEKDVIRAEMIAHCQATIPLYIGTDEYRLAMWRRRLWGHEHGKDSMAWDGDDDIVAMQAIDRYEAMSEQEKAALASRLPVSTRFKPHHATKPLNEG